MARLGEQLARAGLVSADKVEQALRAQVVWGGRLGTNLIELGCIDLDELSRALGQQHGVPAALARHFDKADPALQAQLPPEVAQQFAVVPLVRLSPERIAVVALDPLTPDALAALAAVYDVDARTGIVMSVAAEMRVLYHLERAYKIPRPTRYLRSKSGSVTTFPQFDLSFELDVEVEPDIVAELAPIEPALETDLGDDIDAATSALLQVDADEAAALIERAIETATTPAPDAGPAGRDRRTYLRTLADEVPPAAPVVDSPTVQAPSFDAPTVSAPEATAAALRASVATPANALGRIPLRRVAVAADPLRAGAPTNFAEATRAIKRGPHRDRVAELVIETLERFVPSCAAALLLVIRGGVAIGWKHFSRASDGSFEVAVPLDHEGLVPTAIASKLIARSAAADLGALDQLLLRAVGNADGADLVVVPVTIADQVMCLLAASTHSGTELAPLEAVASAAGAAFTRLIRDASR